MAAARAIGSQVYIQLGLGIAFAAALGQKHLDKARDAALQLQALANETGSLPILLNTLMAFGALAVAIGQPRRGAQLAGAVESLFRGVGIDISTAGGTGSSTFYKYFLQLMRAQLGEATLNAAMAEGGALTLEQALVLAEEIQAQAARASPV